MRKRLTSLRRYPAALTPTPSARHCATKVNLTARTLSGMSGEEPLLRIVRGVPTAEELAALVGAIVARPRPAAGPTPAPASTWARSARPGSAGQLPGPGAWRASGLPY